MRGRESGDDPASVYLDAVLMLHGAHQEMAGLKNELAHLRPLDLLGRLGVRASIREAHENEARRAATVEHLSDEALLNALAQRVVHALLVRVRQSHRNLFHPEVLADLDSIVPAISERIDEPGVLGYAWSNKTVAQFPALQERLTTDFIRQYIADAVSHHQAIAAHPTMLSAWSEDRRTLVVQHQASGLRARFSLLTADPGDQGEFGGLLSKPYEIASIDPAGDGHPDSWQSVAGLGIGTRIYLEGARLLPSIRWRSSAANVYSAAVRRRLHHQDPYTWQYSSCDWCLERSGRLSGWAQIPAVGFDNHPARNRS